MNPLSSKTRSEDSSSMETLIFTNLEQSRGWKSWRQDQPAERKLHEDWSHLHPASFAEWKEQFLEEEEERMEFNSSQIAANSAEGIRTNNRRDRAHSFCQVLPKNSNNTHPGRNQLPYEPSKGSNFVCSESVGEKRSCPHSVQPAIDPRKWLNLDPLRLNLNRGEVCSPLVLDGSAKPFPNWVEAEIRRNLQSTAQSFTPGLCSNDISTNRSSAMVASARLLPSRQASPSYPLFTYSQPESEPEGRAPTTPIGMAITATAENDKQSSSQFKAKSLDVSSSSRLATNTDTSRDSRFCIEEEVTQQSIESNVAAYGPPGRGRSLASWRGTLAAHRAAKSGDIDALRQIWWADRKLFRSIDSKGQTAAHAAARACQVPAITFLVDKIPQLFSVRDSRGRTAAELVISNTALLQLINRTNPSAVGILLTAADETVESGQIAESPSIATQQPIDMICGSPCFSSQQTKNYEAESDSEEHPIKAARKQPTLNDAMQADPISITNLDSQQKTFSEVVGRVPDVIRSFLEDSGLKSQVISLSLHDRQDMESWI